MCEAQVCAIQEKILQIQEFFKPFKCVVNAHMTSFITENQWNMLPEGIRDEALLLSKRDFYEIFWNWGSGNGNAHQSTAVHRLFNDCFSLSLASNSFCGFEFTHEKYNNLSQESGKCMSPKKYHEITNLKEVVAYLCECSDANCVVDVGGGKGYLGAALVLDKGINVLSIDSKFGNTKGAGHTFQKIGRDLSTEGCPSVLYKQITSFITPATNLRLFVREQFGTTTKYEICLTGLHVCGDLASTCLQLFCNSQDVLSMCSIGCCYNLLSEMFELEQETVSSTKQFGFPMSGFLKSQCYSIGRNARMIACQAMDRICSEKRTMNINLYWRAVLQVHLETLFGPKCDFSVGRHCAKATSLSDYLHKAEKSLKINLQLTDAKIESLAREMSEFHDSMAKFYCFRLAFAPVVETLLILDKLLYLLEQGVKNAYICKLFDGVRSPRCYGIIAMKTKDHKISNDFRV